MGTMVGDRAATTTGAWREVTFSVARARRALPYISSIVRDASEAYHVVRHCRAALEREPAAKADARLARERDAALARLSAAADDCNAVGVDLLDISRGLVRFTAEIGGGPVSLLWHLGEPIDSAWSELDQPEPQLVAGP